MSEFRQIEKAPLYEIDKEGNVRKIAKQTPILPYPLNSGNVYLNISEKVRKPFAISDLLDEVWGKKIEFLSGQNGREKAGNIIQAKPAGSGIVHDGVDYAIKSEKVAETTPNSVIKHSPEVDKIMKANCYMSVKIWKMFQAGKTAKEIAEIVGYPNAANVPATIDKYKKNDTLRKRADKVKV